MERYFGPDAQTYKDCIKEVAKRNHSCWEAKTKSADTIEEGWGPLKDLITVLNMSISNSTQLTNFEKMVSQQLDLDLFLKVAAFDMLTGKNFFFIFIFYN